MVKGVSSAMASVAGAAGTNATVSTPKPPPFQISSIHEAQRYLKLFVYGGYGTGKTRLAGSSVLVPQMHDVLMIDAEAGDLTIATDNDAMEQDARSHIDVVRVSTFKEFARVQEFLKLHCALRERRDFNKMKELESRLRSDFDPDAPPREYKTVIIDSLAEIEAFSMYQMLGITDVTKLDEDTASAEWSEYKKNHTQILRSVRAYRDLPMNVIITSPSSYVQDDKKRMVHQPALTGKLAKQVQGFMDMVGFLTMTSTPEKEFIRRLYVQPSDRFDAKNRFSSFTSNFFEDPTIESILRSIKLLK